MVHKSSDQVRDLLRPVWPMWSVEPIEFHFCFPCSVWFEKKNYLNFSFQSKRRTRATCCLLGECARVPVYRRGYVYVDMAQNRIDCSLSSLADEMPKAPCFGHTHTRACMVKMIWRGSSSPPRVFKKEPLGYKLSNYNSHPSHSHSCPLFLNKFPPSRNRNNKIPPKKMGENSQRKIVDQRKPRRRR